MIIDNFVYKKSEVKQIPQLTQGLTINKWQGQYLRPAVCLPSLDSKLKVKLLKDETEAPVFAPWSAYHIALAQQRLSKYLPSGRKEATGEKISERKVWLMKDTTSLKSGS